jgi:hypothetical protein
MKKSMEKTEEKLVLLELDNAECTIARKRKEMRERETL